jgi:hypothetical protein
MAARMGNCSNAEYNHQEDLPLPAGRVLVVPGRSVVDRPYIFLLTHRAQVSAHASSLQKEKICM